MVETVMFADLHLIVLYIYLLKLISVTGLTEFSGQFKVLRKSTNIKHCAAKLLPKARYSGVRASNTTIQCERLFGPLDENSMEPGYGYAKLISMKESYMPPKEIRHREPWTFDAFGIFGVDSRMDFNFTWPEKTWDTICLLFYEAPGTRNMFQACAKGSLKYMYFQDQDTEGIGDKILEVYYDDDLPGTTSGISFGSHDNNTIEVILNGKTIMKRRINNVRLDLVAFVELFLRIDDDTLLLINGMEFKNEV